jgi:hypothetical protein
VAVDRHAKGIADEKHVDTGGIEDGSHGGVIDSDHRHAFAFLFAQGEIRRADRAEIGHPVYSML